MKIEGKEYRTIWFDKDKKAVKIIDQTKLPHQFIIKDLKTVKDAIIAIKTMEVRGAPLIGGTAAYGIVLAVLENNDLEFIKKSSELLKKNGLMFVATLNKTLKSYAFAIIGAEYILRWLPIGTHNWEKFVKPEDLIKISEKNNLNLEIYIS